MRIGFWGVIYLRPGRARILQSGSPNALSVSVIGDWNGWSADADRLQPRADGSGIWEGTARGVQQGQAYKYRIVSREWGQVLEKADPVGFYSELPPATASRAWRLDYDWQDGEWMASRCPATDSVARWPSTRRIWVPGAARTARS